MPITPASLTSQYIFENPWPLTGLLVLAGLIIGWKALTEGDRPKRNVAAALLAAGGVVAALGAYVTTSGEHARQTVKDFVLRAEAADIDGMLALMTDSCLLHYGAPENPGSPRQDWMHIIQALQGKYRIEENQITNLKAESVSGNAATVDLSCRTTMSGFPTASSWWLRVSEQADGSWRIERIAALRLNGQRPNPGSF
ncbi:MAG: hypothetical protein SGJ11_17210 [Phycisphaerae bacterium]|nr:hypothetical protein [Phycisphaerae bacterium]